VILCIGLAVGIDYSPFYVRRTREERAHGRTPAEALQVAAATSGRAILISGFTVMIAMTGMFLMGNQLFTAFLLLLVSFRSIVIAVTTIVLDLLSVGAAYGVLVLIFQQGHLQSLLDFTSIGGVIGWRPRFLFVVLFGLSMDYHVFILSRIREAYDRGMSTERAVAHGIKVSAGVVTRAAIVMVAVFAIFATLNEIVFKMLGVGLAVAVLLDATIVRAVLLPGTMKLLGEWNWYLPSWLEWLPRVAAEPPAAPARGPDVSVASRPGARPTPPVHRNRPNQPLQKH
jgi:uncharacterized membrane protein YdfJ with MMPL/SSD domain